MREKWHDCEEWFGFRESGAQRQGRQMMPAWTTWTEEYRRNQPQQVAFQECVDRLAIVADEQEVPADADDGDNKR